MKSKPMITYILIGIAVVVVVFLIVVATRPSDFRVTRSTTIAASPDRAFEHVNDFHKWDAWSPWAKVDPNCKNTFDGAPAGKGAGFAWQGNKEVGAGRMTIVESRPNDLIGINLEFLKPFKANNTAEFTFKPVGNQTAVTWSMSGKNSFMFKAVGLFLDCDKMVGGQFEQGLANMKSLVEATAKR